MTHSDLIAMRDRLVEDARLSGQAPVVVERYLNSYLRQIVAEMQRTQTVFYQP